MGVVYHARDQKTGRDVAVKVLHPHLRRDPAYCERFKREALIAHALDSRHVVRVLDSDEDEAMIVMEYVEGITLAERLRRGPIPVAEALDIAIQIARGLEEAHDKNVLHRDVKPQNVILQPDGDVKVADFGIARVQEQTDATLTGDVLGAIHYMAPERFSRETDARGDIYSLGVILYEMLAGRQPFNGPVTFATVRQIMEDDPEHLLTINPSIDSRLAVLVHACLAKDPEKRPQSALEVRRALEALREEYGEVEDVAAVRRHPFGPPATIRAGRRPVALRLGLAAMILGPVIGLIIAFALSTEGESPQAMTVLTLKEVALREGPGLEYRELRLVPEGTRLAVLARSTDSAWLLVDLAQDAAQGWLPVPAIESGFNASALAVATSAVPTPQSPVAASCQVGESEPIHVVLERCRDAAIEYSSDCLRGQVCGVRADNGKAVLVANDQTVAYIDHEGNLVVNNIAGDNPRRLTGHGHARQPSWSPDGRYIAYVFTEPLNPEASPLERLYAFQLRIIEVDRPANEGVLVASTELDTVQEWQRRRIVAPRWSPDGQQIYFAWAGRDNRASAIFSVAVPRLGTSVDIRALRIDSPPDMTYLPSSVRQVAVSPAAFDERSSYFGGFAVLADGSLLLQHCRDEEGARCGLGRWDGLIPHRVLQVQGSESFSLAGTGPDGYSAFGYFFGQGGEDWLVRLNAFGERQDLLRFDATRAGGPLFSRRVAVSPDGTRLLVDTAGEPRSLSLVGVGEEYDALWNQGQSPAWYSLPPGAAGGLVRLPLEPVPVPTATPQPAPSPTPQLGTVDLEANLVAGTCMLDRELFVRVRNVGNAAVDNELIFLQVSTPTGFIHSAPAPVRATLRPGDSIDISTGYRVRESVIVRVDPNRILRETNIQNNTVRCDP
jgi:tRNA A-37 threonylcarbamoyl transferase component Bud32